LQIEEIARGAVDAGYTVHTKLGPGLLVFSTTASNGLSKIIQTSRLRIIWSFRLPALVGSFACARRLTRDSHVGSESNERL
jgi:hypothetical protein